MADPPSISIVIPCRNEAGRLPALLASLQGQPVEGWKDTIVVDDGSIDGTAVVAEAHAGDLPGFRVVRTTGRGRPAACNTGAAAAEGEAIVFIDGDDEVAPGFLAAMRASLATHPLAAARLDHDSLNPGWIRGTRPAEQADGLRAEPHLPHPVALGTALGVRREVLEATGGFDESWPNAEDTDLCWRAALAGFPLAFVPDAVVRYRYRTTPRAQYRQARGYGGGGALLDRRYRRRRRAHRATRVVVRTLRLIAVGRRLPRFRDRSVRAAAAFEAGLLVGWLQVTLAPRRYVDPAALRQPRPFAVVPAADGTVVHAGVPTDHVEDGDRRGQGPVLAVPPEGGWVASGS